MPGNVSAINSVFKESVNQPVVPTLPVQIFNSVRTIYVRKNYVAVQTTIVPFRKNVFRTLLVKQNVKMPARSQYAVETPNVVYKITKPSVHANQDTVEMQMMINLAVDTLNVNRTLSVRMTNFAINICARLPV